ncbi:MAG: S9 family peptidase [Alphaproteobacteria bacterium]|nr:S9 family peptidase [Alphaproteobacteria bacterium]
MAHNPAANPPIAPPIAKRISESDTRHGHTRTDDYAWLRDPHWQDVMRDPSCLAPAIRSHLEAENDYTQSVLAPTQDIQATLFSEMRSRIEENENHLPVNQYGVSWAMRYEAGGDHPLICKGARGAKLADVPSMEVILDINAESTTSDYFKLAAFMPCPQNKHLAWGYDDKGSEYITIKIRAIETKTDTADIITHANPSFEWSQCGNYLFYVAQDENHRPYKIMRHTLGTAQAQDICIYEESTPTFYLDLDKTRSGRFLTITPHDHETSETYILSSIVAANTSSSGTDAAPICVAPRQTGIEYHIDDDMHRNRLLIRSNRDALDFQIFTAPIPTQDATHKNWQPLIPHREGCLILDMAVFAQHLALLVRKDALPIIEIITSSDSGDTYTTNIIDFATPPYDLDFGIMAEYETTTLRFNYSSMTTPAQIYDYEMATNSRTLKKERVVEGYNKDDYITRRLFTTARDGKTKIPVSLLYHKDTPLDGTAPCLLYGYGAYGITIPAAFSGNRLSLVERGFIYAIAHIRGGRACGQNWFLAARRENKVNSFTDFIDVAKDLIALNYTATKKITIHGGSAGGLLVGAATNMAPDLFLGVVAEVPFVDNLNTMLDDTLPLTPPEWREWGNPIKDKTAYKIIAAYAPYETITPRAYPHILATAGLTDPRVTYWEPAKWVARLRHTRTDTRLTLLHTYMQAGHGGKAGRFNQLYEIAFVYAFILMINNITK